jgi:hypothetical protein
MFIFLPFHTPVRALENVIMNHLVPYKVGNFLKAEKIVPSQYELCFMAFH